MPTLFSKAVFIIFILATVIALNGIASLFVRF